jgi:predicted DNA-binding transcriptional regulator AlpA
LGEEVKMKGIGNNCETVIPQDAALAALKEEQRWLSYTQLAARMGVCERTIRRDVDGGNLPRPIKIRGCVRFDWLEVEAALNARKRK